MEKTFTIEQNLVIALGQYLVSRPYQEVAQLVSALAALKEVPNDKSEDA